MPVIGSRRLKSDPRNNEYFQSCSEEVQNVAGSGGPRNKAPLRFPTQFAVARSKTRLRFIFGLNWKSKLSSSLFGSRNCACLRRRSRSRLLRQASSSETRMEVKSMGSHVLRLRLQ